MATVIFNDPSIFYSSLDVSAAHTAVAIGAGAEALDDTAFGDDTRSNKGGLKTVDISAEGYFNANTTLDQVYFGQVGGSQAAITIIPETIAVGNVSYFINTLGSSYNPMTGSVGEILKFNIQALAQKSNLIRGQVEFSGTATSSSASTGAQVGAITATQKMYCAVHVTSAGGGGATLDIDLQSDDNSGFTSAITRASTSQFTTARGSEIISASGAITDDWWRINYTIAGSSPTFTFTISLGIGE